MAPKSGIVPGQRAEGVVVTFDRKGHEFTKEVARVQMRQYLRANQRVVSVQHTDEVVVHREKGDPVRWEQSPYGSDGGPVHQLPVTHHAVGDATRLTQGVCGISPLVGSLKQKLVFDWAFASEKISFIQWGQSFCALVSIGSKFENLPLDPSGFSTSSIPVLHANAM